MNLGPRLPCEVCGGRDVDILAAVPTPNGPQSHALQVVHVGGRRCWVGVISGPIGATTKRLVLSTPPPQE